MNFQALTALASVFKRVNLAAPLRSTTVGGLSTPPGVTFQPMIDYNDDHHAPPLIGCVACQSVHIQGNCALKRAGVEICNLCGIAHFGHQRVCPHINSETQVRNMLLALKESPESGTLVKEARRYLTGVKGTLVQKKKMEMESRKQAEAARSGGGNHAYNGQAGGYNAMIMQQYGHAMAQQQQAINGVTAYNAPGSGQVTH